MVADVQAFNCLFPTGGNPNSLTTFKLSMPPRIVRTVEFMIPYGNRGAVSFALGMAGTQIVPSNAGAFIQGDDQTISWPLDGFPDSGAWQLFGFNGGTFPHLIQVRFLCDLPTGPPAAILQPLALSALSP